LVLVNVVLQRILYHQVRNLLHTKYQTASFVENKRPHIEKAVNELIDCVLDFYNYTDTSVVSKFSKIGLTNFNNVVNQVAILKQNGLIDERNALSMIFPDKNENQIDAIQEAQAKEIKTNEIEAHEDIARSGINTVPNPEKDG